MGWEMRYRDGIPLEWRITLFYVCAASVLTVVIIIADFNHAMAVREQLIALRESIATHNNDFCEASTKQKTVLD
jgi:hypothetical protein